MLSLSEKIKGHRYTSGKVGNFRTSEFEIPQLGPPNQASEKQILQASIKTRGKRVQINEFSKL